MFTTPFGSVISQRWLSLSLVDGMILGFVAFCVLYLIFWRGKRDKKHIYVCLLFIYTGALISLTQRIVWPCTWTFSAERAVYVIKGIRWEPLKWSLRIFNNCRAAGNYGTFIRVIGGNFVMLMPLAVLVPLINKRMKFRHMSLFALGVSLSIEALQLFHNIVGYTIRTVETDDVILNTSGCILTYLIFAGVQKLANQYRRKKEIHS